MSKSVGFNPDCILESPREFLKFADAQFPPPERLLYLVGAGALALEYLKSPVSDLHVQAALRITSKCMLKQNSFLLPECLTKYPILLEVLNIYLVQRVEQAFHFVQSQLLWPLPCEHIISCAECNENILTIFRKAFLIFKLYSI